MLRSIDHRSQEHSTVAAFSQDGMKSSSMDLRNKRVTVVGLARTGMASVRFLLTQGAQVAATDLKTERELIEQAAMLKPLGVDLDLGGHSSNRLLASDLILLSPGVPLSLEPLQEALAKGIPVISEVELAFQFLRGRIVGITGSNGKTTVTTLIHELLVGAGLFSQVGGNIGTPLIALLDSSRENGFTVTELSSFQLEATQRFRAHIAVVTNISPDHLDRHGTMEAYLRAKERIFRNQTAEDWAILNADDPIVSAMPGRTAARVLYFSRRQQPTEGVFVRGSRIVCRIDGAEQELLGVSEIPLRGGHNVENVLASLGAGLAAGAEPELMTEAVRNFRGVEHRLEWVAEINGVDYFNDSKATNVDSTMKALEAFPSNILLIAGGKDKDTDYTPLRPLVERRVKRLILIGAAADKIYRALAGSAPDVRAKTMAEAVRFAYEAAEPGDVVLLAPACASFDMFENFEHRGRIFKVEVRALAEAHVREKS